MRMRGGWWTGGRRKRKRKRRMPIQLILITWVYMPTSIWRQPLKVGSISDLYRSRKWFLIRSSHCLTYNFYNHLIEKIDINTFFLLIWQPYHRFQCSPSQDSTWHYKSWVDLFVWMSLLYLINHHLFFCTSFLS